jgi:TorA maturation chaperone TorD
MDALAHEHLFDAAAALLLKRPEPDLIRQAAALFGRTWDKGERLLAEEDWRDLFFVPTSGRYLPPFESAFREKRLGGLLAASVLADYQTAGFEPCALAVDPLWLAVPGPDHLGVELAFVSALKSGAARDPEAAPGLMASAARFHAAHLAPWAGDYGRELARAARSAVYRDLGGLLTELGGGGAWKP